MAVQAERSLHSWYRACSRERLPQALYACVAAFAVLIGVLGLLGVSWLRQLLESWINIHVLFGLLLCGLVFVRYRWRVEHSPRAAPAAADIRELSRHLSRVVYLSLYAVIGLRQIIGILNTLWHGGAVGFSLFDEHSQFGPDHAGFNSKDDFQLFLASGLVTLVFVRFLAFRLWSRRLAPSSTRASTQ
jgi:cytochrome b561